MGQIRLSLLFFPSFVHLFFLFSCSVVVFLFVSLFLFFFFLPIYHSFYFLTKAFSMRCRCMEELVNVKKKSL